MNAGQCPKKIYDSPLVSDHLVFEDESDAGKQLDPGARALIATEVPQPRPGEGELLIGVRAAGVTPTELYWYPKELKRKMARHAKGLCRGMSAPQRVIAELGKNASGFEVGQEIYGPERLVCGRRNRRVLSHNALRA